MSLPAPDVPRSPTERPALQILVDQARPGDVVGLMCHAEREDVLAWLDEQGAVADTPEVLREKVRRNGG